MNNYNIVVNTEAEKQQIAALIRRVGARLTGVSGYYGGAYYIQLDATPAQADALNAALQGVST